MSKETLLHLAALALSGAALAALVGSGIITLGTWFVLLVITVNAGAILTPPEEDVSVLDKLIYANGFLLLPLFVPSTAVLVFLVELLEKDEDDDE